MFFSKCLSCRKIGFQGVVGRENTKPDTLVGYPALQALQPLFFRS
ncbi:hypothetical protein HMPREF9442_00933 [Paraprevotella xylaniphila YIT 11841]|uniref:Uncharacterized protein n=1 Tax=Paraprevotella xylaniphila YIT 11841 TaxID=762982 RepID=F3QRX8_9BACT|nr:hypothetical protein HMPREF9442_00933 [Paraprevotella xylaniphila YIT 11841]